MDPVTTATATTAMTVAVEGFSVLTLFSEASLFVKLVMIFLLGMSILTWAVLIAKFKLFRQLKNKADRFEEAFWSNNGLEDLYKNTNPEDTDHPMAKIFVVGLREWEHAVDSEANNNILELGVIDRVRQLMSVNLNRELDRIEKMLPILATIGSTAPFIGLLGTVVGIMNSFQSIGLSKNTSLAVVAPGIAEALLATALGLFAAIPAVMAYNKLSSELGRYAARLEGFAMEFVTILDRKNQQKLARTKKTKQKRRAQDKLSGIFNQAS
jgi:biopolymer transport protein TolQ